MFSYLCPVSCSQSFLNKNFPLTLEIEQIMFVHTFSFSAEVKNVHRQGNTCLPKIEKTGGLEKLITEVSLPRIIFNAKFLNGTFIPLLAILFPHERCRALFVKKTLIK